MYGLINPFTSISFDRVTLGRFKLKGLITMGMDEVHMEIQVSNVSFTCTVTAK